MRHVSKEAGEAVASLKPMSHAPVSLSGAVEFLARLQTQAELLGSNAGTLEMSTN